MGRFVVVAYAPKPGMDDLLLEVVRKHLAVLRNEDLVTDRSADVMKAIEGTLVEVFEWRSVEAISLAHTLAGDQALWADFAVACDYRPLKDLAECGEMFAEFDAIEI